MRQSKLSMLGVLLGLSANIEPSFSAREYAPARPYAPQGKHNTPQHPSRIPKRYRIDSHPAHAMHKLLYGPK